MSTYHAPLEDMLFVLRELAGVDALAQLPGFEEATPEVVDAVLNEAARFAREVLDPLNKIGDEQGARLQEGNVTAPEGYAAAYRKFTEAGWNGLTGDPEYGG